MTRQSLPPGSTIAILGGGQLGRMLAMAAARLGMRTRVFSDRSGDPAFDVSDQCHCGSFGDSQAIARFVDGADAVTYEFENIPLDAIDAAIAFAPVRPDRRALAVTQDRLAERQFLERLSIPVSTYHQVASLADLELAASRIDLPAILKTRRLGYDGKGQVRLERGGDTDLSEAWATIAETPAILERMIPFDRELSIVAVRSLSGETVFYDLSENKHGNQILQCTQVPSTASLRINELAQQIARKIVTELDYVGTIAIEFFLLSDDNQGERLLVNEMAPRVHNSGHWTLNAAVTDQFENHIRAICDWPLGATERFADAQMVNLIGEDIDAWPDHAKTPNACMHLYGKRNVRAGRKMGHVTTIKPKT